MSTKKPSIIEVIRKRVELRKAGKEYIGLCPFHADKTPSLSVNEDKGLFHCFGCGASGDVIDFVMQLDGLTFRDAAESLGISSELKRAPLVSSKNQQAAAMLADWLNESHLTIGGLCRELSQEIAIAQRIPDPELSTSLEREWEILSDLHGDLQNPLLAGEMLAAKDTIDEITAHAQPEPLMEFPPLRPGYRSYLKGLHKC
jgi:DNA primase